MNAEPVMLVSTYKGMKTGGTKDRILEAGLRLFSEKGYLGTTTRDIARLAGVAEVTLFRHFASKERLFEEVINTFTFLPALKGLLPTLKGLEYRDALEVIAGRFLERLTERKQMIHIMHAEIHRYPAKVKEIYDNFIDEVFRTLASYFRDLQKEGVLREFDPELGAGAFLGMFFSFFISRELLRKRVALQTDLPTVISGFVEIFCNGTAAGKRGAGCGVSKSQPRAGVRSA